MPLIGVNLTDKLPAAPTNPWKEQDFELVKLLGFNFVRLNIPWLAWKKPNVWTHIKQAVTWGRQREIHVQPALHNYPDQMWTNEATLKLAEAFWRELVQRVGGQGMSCNLLNEPHQITMTQYMRVHQRLSLASPGALAVADGMRWARDPVPSLSTPQACHVYDPIQLSHWGMPNKPAWKTPKWPLKMGKTNIWDRARLVKEFAPWVALKQTGISVHIGEIGFYRTVPYEVGIAWMTDWVSIFKQHGVGYALWGLYGNFGLLDVKRPGMTPAPFHGHQLDQRMWQVLKP